MLNLGAAILLAALAKDMQRAEDAMLCGPPAQEYHTAADRLQLIPASAKRAAGVQFEATLDRAGTTASELINVDLKARPPRFSFSCAPPLRADWSLDMCCSKRPCRAAQAVLAGVAQLNGCYTINNRVL